MNTPHLDAIANQPSEDAASSPETMPHLSGVATLDDDSATPRPHATTLYLLGYADAVRAETARQVAAMSTIEDARALHAKASRDFAAGTIDRRELDRAHTIASDAMLALAESVEHHDCPDWCNAHHFVYGAEPVEDIDAHRHLIETDDWSVELEEGEGDAAGTVQFIDERGEEHPLIEARAYARAILAACDAVEAPVPAL